MVLEHLTDGASGRLSVDEGTRKLVFILCLPLVDGVFATLLVTGAMETFSNMVSVAVTVFAGAGSLAVLYSYSDCRREALKMVGKAAPILLFGALIISLVAPVYEQFLHLERMEYVAGLVLLAIARDIADIDILRTVSAEAILLTGIILSLRSPEALAFSLEYLLPALTTVVLAISGLTVGALIEPQRLKMEYVRKGAAIILVMLSVSLFGVSLPSELSVLVFVGSLAYSHEDLEPLHFETDI